MSKCSFLRNRCSIYCFLAISHSTKGSLLFMRKSWKNFESDPHTSTEKQQSLAKPHKPFSLLLENLTKYQQPSPKPRPPPMSLSHFIILIPLILLLSSHKASSSLPIVPLKGTCQTQCGTIPIKFPFGTAYGCGHPSFSRYIKCNFNTLQFSTQAGIYTISSIDYPTNTIIITDAFMSNCSSMQNSGSFSLDKASPFTLTNQNIFVLLGCSATSPVFDPREDFCDTGSGSRVCRGLYSCKGVLGIGLPQNAPSSTCCVYDSPADEIGSGYSLDLPKLQCSSYTSIYEFGDEGDPMKWKFGISLMYNDSYYSDGCKDCEASGGLCGFSGLDESFACVCRNGVNTTTNCYGQGYAWSGTLGLKIQTMLTIGGT